VQRATRGVEEGGPPPFDGKKVNLVGGGLVGSPSRKEGRAGGHIQHTETPGNRSQHAREQLKSFAEKKGHLEKARPAEGPGNHWGGIKNKGVTKGFQGYGKMLNDPKRLKCRPRL